MNKKKLEESEILDGLDGYYFTGEVDKQTLRDDRSLKGELDQYAFRDHSFAENYHGVPEYAMEEDWREWGKFNSDDFSKASGMTYRDQALEKKRKDELTSFLTDTLEVESLTVTVIGPNVFVSGRVKTAMDDEEITELIKGTFGFSNVVNHIIITNDVMQGSGPANILKKDLGLDGESYER